MAGCTARIQDARIRSGPAATEPDPGSAVYREADWQACGIVAEQEIQEIENDRAVSSWMTGIRPDGPVPELPKEIAERLLPDQQEEIQDVIDAGTPSRSDPETFKEIFLGLTSDDAGERTKWAREPLSSYRPQLSEKDYANLVLIQRNISARDGVPIEGVGYPLGTLDDHAELAAALLTGGVGGAGRPRLRSPARRRSGSPAKPSGPAAGPWRRSRARTNRRLQRMDQLKEQAGPAWAVSRARLAR